MRITMIPRARRERLRAAHRYDRERHGLGDRFFDPIREGLASILEYPSAHPPIIETPYRHKLINGFPYAVVYRVDGARATMVAVANFSRTPRYWAGRASRLKGARKNPHA